MHTPLLKTDTLYIWACVLLKQIMCSSIENKNKIVCNYVAKVWIRKTELLSKYPGWRFLYISNVN